MLCIEEGEDGLMVWFTKNYLPTLSLVTKLKVPFKGELILCSE
jgi:hypothetical protein